MKTTIVVNLQVEGVHHWTNCSIEEVSYLKHPHRHMFHISVEKEVGHDDRDIEIIRFKQDVEDYLQINYFNGDMHLCYFGDMSCEMIAKEILEKFDCYIVQVLEDGENGAKVYA